MHFGIECVSATWDERGFWTVHLRDNLTGIDYTRNPPSTTYQRL